MEMMQQPRPRTARKGYIAEELLALPHRRLAGSDPLCRAAVRRWGLLDTPLPRIHDLAVLALVQLSQDSGGTNHPGLGPLKKYAQAYYGERRQPPDIVPLDVDALMPFALFLRGGGAEWPGSELLVFGSYRAFEHDLILARMDGLV